MAPTDADALRNAFLDFFAARGHRVVPSASLIPHDPSLLFTVAGMVPFKPYFVGDESPPSPRATSAQKCVRAGGKHNDLDDIGRTNRHFSFFEMLGNFSFGDYFKSEAIAWAWEFVTGVLELDPERLWVTVHTGDDDAARIWREEIGLAPERIQRLDADNFWQMADTGPCGPCSEIFWDLGPDHGADGGPAVGGEDRFIEIWNLVFMQYDQHADGSRSPLPRPSIDTGAGLERMLFVLEGKASIFDTALFRPLIGAAEDVTGRTYGGSADPADTSLRILAEHGRTMTFLVSDGVVPSNEERGYVLRRIIRRAARHAYLLGVQTSVTPALVDATVDVMGGAYPELKRDHDQIRTIVEREERRFRQTLARGLDLLDDLLGTGDVSGDDAFFLHDTYGFPIDLTREIARERGHAVDLDGFDRRMAEQRERAQAAHRAAAASGATPTEVYRELLEDFGATTFTGRQEYVTPGARVVGLVVDGVRVEHAPPDTTADLFLDRSPFYAESGGQVGDTGVLREPETSEVVATVTDTQYAIAGSMVRHRVSVTSSGITVGDLVDASIDGPRRDRIRRNHTATHVLHWALRSVLGEHVQQAGSAVGPDRLRFDFSHHEALSGEQLVEIERLANQEVITDAPVRHYETTKEYAASIGAIAFFGDKYGDVVRVLEAGEHSIELCGGTHVHALGFIGPIKIVSEGSIGANTRRIEAVTGEAALEHIRAEEARLERIAALVRSTPAEVEDRVGRLVAQVKELQDGLESLRAQQAVAEAKEIAAGATDAIAISRRDDLTPDDLRRLALAVRDVLGTGIVALVGAGPDGKKAGIAVAVSNDLVARGAAAAAIAQAAARALGGGTAKQADVVAGGGPHVEEIDTALELVTSAAQQALAALGA